MISQEEMRVLDRNAEFFGVSIQGLMENAGGAVADSVLKEFNGRGKKILILCGTGNNGGDGLTAARLLKDDADVTVVLARSADRIATKEAKEAFQKVKGQVKIVDGPASVDELMTSTDIVIDGLLGIGIRGEIAEPYATLIKKVNSSGKPILSIDVPSGLGANLTVQPKVTVALHDEKIGMTPQNSGKIVVADIGIPQELVDRIGPGEFLYYPRKKEDSHKGDNGRLLIIGGGPFTGAPAFAGLAAYRIGVDVVHVSTPTIAYQAIASFSPNFIVHPLAGASLLHDDLPEIFELAHGMDAVVIGPGLGASDHTLSVVRDIISTLNIPLVIDADAITAVSRNLAILKNKTGVITPHAREYLTLSGEKLPNDLKQKAEMVKAFAKKVGFTILLKGHVDVVTDGASVKYNVTHNPAMTVGGTGDSLAGIVGGLLAKRMRPFEAARLGAFVNGYAGNLAYAEKSYGMMTSDLIEKIPNALLEFVR